MAAPNVAAERGRYIDLLGRTVIVPRGQVIPDGWTPVAGGKAKRGPGAQRRGRGRRGQVQGKAETGPAEDK